jgi:cytochrome c556
MSILKTLIPLVAALLGLASTGLPQDKPAAVSGPDAIAARQASLDMSSITFRSMGEAVKSGREAKSQAYAAASLAKWAKALPSMFPQGTGQGETASFSQALPTVWQDRPGFESAAAYYAATTAKLAGLGAANDTPGFTKQLEAVNQACAACHARYKAGDQAAPKK